MLDLRREKTFVFAVVPFSQFFAGDVMGTLRNMIKEEMERLVGTDSGRDKDHADVLGVDDLFGQQQG